MAFPPTEIRDIFAERLPDINGLKFPCPYCEELFFTLKEMEDHGRLVHEILRLTRCTVCGYFGTVNAETEDKFKCAKCFDIKIPQPTYTNLMGSNLISSAPNVQEITTLKNTKSSKLTKSGKVRKNSILQLTCTPVIPTTMLNLKEQHICMQCNCSFRNHRELLAHIKRHDREPKYKCEFCEKCFFLAENYKCHRRVHTGEKPYICHYCDKAFSQSITLKHHIRIHTGEKPYKCEQCGRAFTVRDYLNKHYRTHTGEKPYECIICRKCFTQQSALNLHKKSHFAA